MSVVLPQSVSDARDRNRFWIDFAWESFVRQMLPIYFMINKTHHMSVRQVISPRFVRSLALADGIVERDGQTYVNGAVVVLSIGDRFTVRGTSDD